MAKGDSGAAQNQINTQTGTAQQNLNNLRTGINAQGGAFGGLFGRAIGTPTGPGGTGDIFSGYGNFATTGGFSPEDITAMRNQATAPVQGIFENARNQILQNAAVQGNQPNTAAALADLGRKQSQAVGDIGTNAMGTIAQLQQQGKLYGLGGLSGLANMFGGDVLANTGQGLQAQQLQNAIGQMAIQGQLGKSQIPGDWQQGVSNVFAPLTGIGKVAGAVAGLPGLFGGGMGGGSTGMNDFGYYS